MRRFIALTPASEERELYERTFSTFYGASARRPEDVADCARLRPKIEADAVEARKVLGLPAPPVPGTSSPPRRR